MKRDIKAFTLAEVLTTLMVIGVVAALVIPGLFHSVNEKILKSQKNVTERKITEGFRRMRMNDKLEEQYSTTGEFVEVMKKYFNKARICDKTALSECFTQTVTHTDKNVYDISTMTTTKKIDGNLGYDTDVYGVVFADGTNALITVNPSKTCLEAQSEIAAEDKARANSLGAISGCTGLIYDVNGKKGPNTVGKDIFMENITFDGFMFKVGGMKLVEAPEYTTFQHLAPQNIEEERALNEKYGFTLNTDPSGYPDMWYAAQRYCADKGLRVPSSAEYAQIIQEVYDNGNNDLKDWLRTRNGRIQRSAYWTSTSNGCCYNWAQYFDEDKNKSGYQINLGKKEGYVKVLCVR